MDTRMPESEPVTVLGIGEILWDLIPGGKQLGGAPTNFAYHARMLGLAAAPVSCVGDDGLGTEILDRLRALGLPAGYVQALAGYDTGTVSISLGPGGSPSYIIHENVAWDHLQCSSALADLAARCRALCFGSLAQRSPTSQATIRRFVRQTPATCLRIFDVNLRQHFYDANVLRDSLSLATAVKLNDDELPIVAEMVSLDEGSLECLRETFDLDVAVVTRGAEGSRIVTRERSDECGSGDVEVADTVGAGDAFTAAFATGLLAGREPAVINRAANRLGTFVASCPGATPGYPPGLVDSLWD